MIMDIVQKSAKVPFLKKRMERSPLWQHRFDELHEKAIKAAGGYDDFGDASYHEAYNILMQSIDEEARLHPVGRWLFEYQIVGMLTNRLMANKYWQEHPEVLQTRIERPLVITGMVRTGSTALHYLMGANPDMQALPYWIATHPQPRPAEHTWKWQTDFYKAKAELAMMYGLGEGLEAIHHITAQGPEECRHLLAQSFTDDCFEVANRVPSYAKWYAAGHHIESYRRHKKLIQMIGSTNPNKRWLLKYPVHIRHIDAFLEVYPDACIIQTHRDPAEVLNSYVSLCAHFRRLQEVDVDRREIALEQMEAWASAVEKGLVAREKYPEQFHDIYFRDFMRDPIGTIEKVYDCYGVEFSRRARAALEDWRIANPQNKWGKHNYKIEEAEVTREEIHERFAKYMDAMGIERESN